MTIDKITNVLYNKRDKTVQGEVNLMKNVLISGGSRGIGAACVRKFAQSGYRVAFTYKTSKDQAEALASEYGAFALYCDLEDEASIVQAAEQAKEYFGEDGTDVLVNNGAISEIKLFSDITSEDWTRMISVNLTAPYVFCREVLGDMIHKKNGRIINVSSMWGICGASCEVHYSAAKAGLIGMSKALAKELAPSSITVNAIAPGVIDTDMNSHLSEDERNALKQEIPLLRMGTADEIAELIFFISSESASYITGQVISSDGGMVI